MPPLSPTSNSMILHQNEKNNLTESQIEKKDRLTQSQIKDNNFEVIKDIIPQFYFDKDDKKLTLNEDEFNLIEDVFKTEKIDFDDFVKLNENLLKFHKFYNKIVFDKLKSNSDNLVHKEDFINVFIYFNKDLFNRL